MMESGPRQNPSANAERPTAAEGKDVAPTQAQFVPTPESAAKLAEHIVMNWVANGGEPTIPANRRDEIVATLTAAMVDVDIYDAYDGELRASSAYYKNKPPLAGYKFTDELPEDEFNANGFSTLDDRTLARIAISPASLYGLYMGVTTQGDHPTTENQVGQWFSNEVKAYEERAGRPYTPTTPLRDMEIQMLMRAAKLV